MRAVHSSQFQHRPLGIPSSQIDNPRAEPKIQISVSDNALEGWNDNLLRSRWIIQESDNVER